MAKNKKRILPKRPPAKAANEDLAKLEEVKERMVEIKEEEDAILERIRNSFRDSVVVFIDMVGSTQFKVDHSDRPETWVLRVQQFSDVIAEYVEKLGGIVVKYIGDEVMAVFDDDSRINDACNLVVRAEEIEGNLADITGVETRIKVAIDKGEVCFLKFDGHEPIDPQGTAIDRCARIGKKAVPGAVLASADFVKECPPGYSWKEAGTVDFKGLGATVVYQMGDRITVDMAPKTEIAEAELRRLRERASTAESQYQKLEIEMGQLAEMNEGLQQQIRDLDAEPSKENSVTYEDEEDETTEWDAIEADISELKKLIERGPAPAGDHARFIFLKQSDHGDKYNSYEGRTFDQCIESKLVEDRGNGYYYLNEEHPLNEKILEVAWRLREKLEKYERDDDDLYTYDLDDPEFWANQIGYYVL